MRSYSETRLLSDTGNIFWQSILAPSMGAYLLVNLTINLSASVIAAPIMPFHIYVYFPSATLCTIMLTFYLFPLLASIRKKSEMSLIQMKIAVPQLLDADRTVRQHTKRLINAQRVFGYKMGSNSFISIGTVQFTLSESISYSLLIISLAQQIRTASDSQSS